MSTHVLSPTRDDAAVWSALQVMKDQRRQGRSPEQAAEQAAKHLAEQLRDYPTGSAS